MKQLKGRVVVITGASSGLGRATALQFAAAGAVVVASARREDALKETVQMCRATGADALHFRADVTLEDDMEALVGFVTSRTGRIDVWVNNAGTTLFGGLDQGPFEAHRRVIETNLLGPMLAARLVWPVFRKQGHGTMINVGSVLSKVAQPFVPSYVISKYGLAGLSEALRADAANDRDIHVCTIYPYAMNTPHFESGANYVGRDAHTMPPAQSPEKVARAIVDLARMPRRSRFVPRIAAAGVLAHALFPRLTERLLKEALVKWHFGNRVKSPNTGNLFVPPSELPKIHGHRPPRLSNLSFAGWLMWRLITMPARNFNSALRRLWRVTLTPERTTPSV